MSHNRAAYRILTTASEVGPHLSEVVRAADSDKDALGFFPASVFEEFARKDLLFVLVVAENTKEAYGGHLLFDARFPRAHVRQVYIAERFRRRKLGEAILDALKEHLTALQFISIHARVAEDLQAANSFWEKQGFYPQRVEPGGIAKKRIIVVRAHELATPQLFESSGITAADPLGLDVRGSEEKPLFLLDLNVLFDLGPRRPRHEQAVAVFRAERMQACALAISSEVHEELKRTGQKGKTDAMQALASALPMFPIPPSDVLAVLTTDLSRLVFPQKDSNSDLTSNDLSDLNHLATAIHHRLPGLITSDLAVLDCAMELRRRYGIEVMSPAAFQIEQPDRHSHVVHGSTSDVVLSIEAVISKDEESIRALLSSLGVEISAQAARWAAVDGNPSLCSRFLVKRAEDVLGYVVWSQNILNGPINASVVVSENTVGAIDAARLLLNHLADHVARSEITRIRLSCPPRQVVVREVAAALGYTRASSRPDELQKVIVRRIVTNENWTATRELLSDACGVALPSVCPNFRHVDQQVPIARPDGEKAHVSIFSLEALLAPALFCINGRAGVLVPVQRKFAEHLLHNSSQGSLLPLARAQLLQQRSYISGPATLNAFSRGDLMFFYESSKDKGRSEVVAVARVLRSYRRQQTDFQMTDLASSVLDADQLDSIGKASVKTVTVFDNLMVLPRSVTLADLKELKLGNPQQLRTSRRLTPQLVQGILSRGLR